MMTDQRPDAPSSPPKHETPWGRTSKTLLGIGMLGLACLGIAESSGFKGEIKADIAAVDVVDFVALGIIRSVETNRL